MSVEATGVEDQRRVGIHINAGVCVPQISVYKRWFDRSALALKWARKPRNDLVKEYWDQDIELGIVSLCLKFKCESPPLSLSARASARATDQLRTKYPHFCGEESARTSKGLFIPTTSIRHKALGKLHRLIGTNAQLDSYPTLAAFHDSDAYNSTETS
jgi:hypothetical protein